MAVLHVEEDSSGARGQLAGFMLNLSREVLP